MTRGLNVLGKTNRTAGAGPGTGTQTRKSNEGGKAHTGSFSGKIGAGTGDDGVFQLTSYTIAEGEAYTLTFWVNDTWKASTGDHTATLYYDDPVNVIGSYTFGSTTSWVEHSFSATATAIAAGQNLGILFEGGGTAYPLIDDVSLSVVPEPSSFALIAGFLGLSWVMLRRRD